jgi:phosphonate transport system ATP-binding protein
MQLNLQGVYARHPAARAQSTPALRGLKLQVQSGEQLAVIGPSGAGKTTLLHLLACALQPSGGAVLLDGSDPWQGGAAGLRAVRQRLFLAPQVPPLPPRQRVITSVLAARLPQWSLAHSLRSLFYPVDIPAAHNALQRFDMEDKIFERVDRLSGGERQRVGLARALLSQAQLLLVDEPLSALDPSRAGQALHTLTQAARDSGATLISTLHHVEMALQHFPRIVGLRAGEVVFDLPAAQVTKTLLQDLYAQQLHELSGPAPESLPPVASALPAVMHCR